MDVRVNVPEEVCPQKFLISLAEKEKRQRFYMHRMCIEKILEDKEVRLNVVDSRESILICWTEDGEETRMFLKEFVRDRWYKVVSIWSSKNIDFLENGLGFKEPKDFIWMQMGAK